MDLATSEWSSDLKPEDIFNLCYFSCLKPDVTEGGVDLAVKPTLDILGLVLLCDFNNS